MSLMAKNESIEIDGVLRAINPMEVDGRLHSPLLNETIAEYRPQEGDLWGAFNEAEPNSLEELRQAKMLALYYFMRTASALQDGQHNPLLWTERFNQASSELYEVPEADEVQSMAREELAGFEEIAPDSYVARVYRQIASADAAAEQGALRLDSFQEGVFEEFEEAVDVISSAPEGPYSAPQIRGLFDEIIGRLGEDRPEWREWRVVDRPGKTMLAVYALNKTIEVPDGRADVETRDELLGLTLHEIGVHAARAVFGYEQNDDMLAKGLPDYGDFEEGLGLLFEYMATGVVPSKSKDRYIDIALACGTVNGVTLTRDELQALGVDREQVRAEARGEVFDEQAADKKIQSHVNRIFRGGTGEVVESDNGPVQPVLTKDIIYYTGFKKATDYVSARLDAGDSPQEIIRYLLSGKFDATNPRHTDYVARYQQ